MDVPLWVFAYGSLIWDPGFAVAESRVARLTGWQRRFCMWSVHYRGTVAQPGLVLALDLAPDGYCDGLALRVEPGAEAETLAALRVRELISYAYHEQTVQVRLNDGRDVPALTYVINPDHDQYGRDLTLVAQAEIIARASGNRGRNCDYLFATTAALARNGIIDPDMTALVERVNQILPA